MQIEFVTVDVFTERRFGGNPLAVVPDAAGLAQGMTVEAAVERARDYVQRAIASAPGFGHGHGPLDHAHPLRAI